MGIHLKPNYDSTIKLKKKKSKPVAVVRPVIPVLRKMRQENYNLEAVLVVQGDIGFFFFKFQTANLIGLKVVEENFQGKIF